MVRSADPIRSIFLRCLFVVVPLIFSCPSHCQDAPVSLESGPPGSDALPFLTEVFSRYAQAKTYRLEYTHEDHLKGQYQHSWNQHSSTAIVAPGNRYRFEERGFMGSGLQISDGQTEWVYSHGLNQYTQEPTPDSGPGHIFTGAAMEVRFLREPQYAIKSTSGFGKEIRTARFASDEDVHIGSQTIPCMVITTEGLLPGSGGEITTAFTFWIDKQSRLIRKYTTRTEGELVPSDPSERYVSEGTALYSVAELNVTSFPDSAFSFVPPKTAVLIKQFESKRSQELTKLEGRPLPAVMLTTSDGRDVPLQSFQGKPLLLDFWATWCQPCRESLPDLQKFYDENKSKGLVMLSVDEDERQQKAVDFWTEHKMPWPNYHVDSHHIDKLPPHGIPYFLLIDSSGIVVLSHEGLDEEKLRTAVASLDHSSTKSQ
jgi:thiol-disulfide isomerase/thioredoxin